MKKEYIDVLNEHNGGVTADTLTAYLRELASRVLANNKQGELTLTLKLKPVKGSQNQAEVESIIKHKMPTIKGDKAETAADTMIMYVSSKGDLSATPQNEYDLPGITQPVTA